MALILHVGDQVEVHTEFNNAWVPGFEIAEIVGDVYRVRRTSDGTVLPNLTGGSDVRPAPSPKPMRIEH